VDDQQDADRIITECRAGVSAMATAFVTRDPDALRYLSGVITSEPNLSASQFMLSSAHLVDDVLTTHVAAALGRDPTDTEIIQAWRSYEATARERNTSSLERLADEQIRAGQPEDEVRRTIANSVGETDAGLATALPLLTAYITGDEAGFHRLLVAANEQRKIAQAVRATPLVIRDLFQGAVAGLYGGKATDDQIRTEWAQFLQQRSAEPGP
jgi:hypothetical protein